MRSRPSRSRSRSNGRSRRRDDGGRRGDRHGGMPQAPAGAAAGMWGQYPGYGAPGFPPQPGFGAPFWDPSGAYAALGGDGRQGDADKDRKKKKKKKKRKAAESSSSSSSSSSEEDWRSKVWKAGMAGQMPGMWPGMPGQMPGMWPWPHPGGPMPPGGMPPPGGPMPPVLDSQSAASAASGNTGSGGQEAPPEDVPIFLEPSIEETVLVPKALLGKVIGKQAQTIIEIREKSGAFKVDARDQTSDPCQVKVAGTADAVKKAKVLIAEILESTKSKHAGSEYVEIPRAKIGMVIGLKGAQVHEIQTQTGTKIDVDFEVDPCRCYIKGNMDQVERAKQVLLTIAMQIEDDRSEYLDLPKTASGALIGAQGSRVREFQEQSGARIDVDKTGSRCRVRLSGTGEQVANAKALILHEVENAANPVQSTSALVQHLPPPPPQPMQIPAHQPSSFPATLSESLARAKAAAQAVKSGIIRAPAPGPEPTQGFSFQQAPAGGMSW